MSQLLEYIAQQAPAIARIVARMTYVTPDKLGLDERAASGLYIDEYCIVVDINEDRSLQYYGGFEYEREFRSEAGEFAVYTADSSRVYECLQRFYEED